MNMTTKSVLMVGLLALSLLAFSGSASAFMLAGNSGPHSCDKDSNGEYNCSGVNNGCLVFWHDDDPNGDPSDGNGTVTKNVCGYFA